MTKRTLSRRSGPHLARYAGSSLLLILLLLSAAGMAPVAQDTGGLLQGQDDQAPVTQETEAVISIAEDATPIPEDATDAVLAAKLEPKVLEQRILPNAIQTVIEIPISQDTYIASNKPNQNFGGAHELRVGWDNTAWWTDMHRSSPQEPDFRRFSGEA